MAKWIQPVFLFTAVLLLILLAMLWEQIGQVQALHLLTSHPSQTFALLDWNLMLKIVQMLCKSIWCTSVLQVSSQAVNCLACSVRLFKVERNYKLMCQKTLDNSISLVLGILKLRIYIVGAPDGSTSAEKHGYSHQEGRSFWSKLSLPIPASHILEMHHFEIWPW